MYKILAIFLCSLPLLLGPFHEGYAGEYASSDEETALLELINEARKDPLAMAASLGMDPETLLRDLPELVDVLTAGLPPLAYEERLYEAALGHTNEMIAYTYYGHTSLDGRTYAERIRETGYAPAECGESLGIVAFQNLMAPEEAVRIIFESIFLAELDPETTKVRNILNPELTETGIGLGSGLFTTDGSALNAYVATLDFARPIVDTKAVERALFAMINRARKDPLLALVNAGIDPAEAAAAYGNLGWVLTEPLPPLAWDEDLHGTAAAHNRDMRHRQYFSTISPDGVTALDRVAGTGYDPVYVGESLAMISAKRDAKEGEEAFAIARQLYEEVLASDLDPECDVERNIFNPFMTEAGIAVAVMFQGQESHQSISYVLVMDFAGPRSQRPFVVGTVYEDHNQNGLVDEGEGIPGAKITVKPSFSAIWDIVATTTGTQGDYQIELSNLPVGGIELFVEFEGYIFGPFSCVVEPSKQNVLKNIPIACKSKEDWAGATQIDKKRLDIQMRICY